MFRDHVISGESVDYGWFKLSVGDDHRYYRWPLMDWPGYGDTVETGSSEDYTEPVEPIPQWEIGFFVRLGGTDGLRYIVELVPDEPVTSPQLTFVIDAETGDVLACGWTRYGMIFVSPDDWHGSVDKPALPPGDMAVNADEQCGEYDYVRHQSLDMGALVDALDVRDRS